MENSTFASEVRAAREVAKGEMLKGAIWIVAGGLISGLTYLSTEPDGSFLVFWGAIAYGAFRVMRAAYIWLNPESLLKR